MDTVNLTYKERVQNFLEQVKDFKDYPTMRKETILGMIGWSIGPFSSTASPSVGFESLQIYIWAI